MDEKDRKYEVAFAHNENKHVLFLDYGIGLKKNRSLYNSRLGYAHPQENITSEGLKID